jgi:hypothetical protein
MQEKYSDTEQAQSFWQGPDVIRQHPLREYSDNALAHNQSINALVGDIRTQCWHIRFCPGPGSIRQHMLSLIIMVWMGGIFGQRARTLVATRPGSSIFQGVGWERGVDIGQSAGKLLAGARLCFCI